MFTRETRTGLAPKSWTAVAVWLVIIAVVISRPGESLGFFFGAIRGTGQWVGYTAFADCDAEPPMEWMEPKPCPEPPTEGEPGPSPEQPTPGPPDEGTATASAGYVVRVDEHAIRNVLDQGSAAVTALHGEVVEIQHNGGLVVEVGHPQHQGADNG